MIRQGRQERWLEEPISTLPVWATFHGVKINGVEIGPLPGFEERGSTVIAADALEAGTSAPLLVVQKDLVVSRTTIDLVARSDRHLREVLEAVGDFGKTTRGAVLIFLLMQATILCPHIDGIGVLNPLTEYIKFLPDEFLPTVWNEEEQDILEGTTLRPAVRAKLNSLLREFEHLRTATENISWCAQYWWHEDHGQVKFDDWLRVDAMYRSRALEFPGVGDCMVPCIDMANHASGDATVALYEADEDGNALLLLREGKVLQPGDEITITYGDEKGACESIFSYGFLEEDMTSAKVMFLDLEVPDDDPLRPAKMFVSTSAPGFRIFDKNDGIGWESDFIWLVVINEEDGLDFKVRQTIDGQREIQAFWKEYELDDTSKLRQYLEGDPLWSIYQLRANVLLQQRVESQLEVLKNMETLQTTQTTGVIRDRTRALAQRLRALETDMLKRAVIALQSEQATLIESPVVQQYLGMSGVEGDEQDDEEVDFT